ncbi:MAG: hypothetical protein Q9209_004648 [Squamulea sp. 1 TL-2023]
MVDFHHTILAWLFTYPLIVGSLALLSLTAYKLLLQPFFHLYGIPGPWWAPYTRAWLFMTLASEDSPSRYIAVNDKYGPLARIGPNHLITNDPETFRKILMPRSKYERGPWFDSLRLNPNRANLITERNASRHNTLRSQMAPGVLVPVLTVQIEAFEQNIQQSLQGWILYVQKHGVSYPGDSPRDFEIGRSIQYLVTDTICLLAFGRLLGFVSKHADCYGFLKTLEERLPIVEKFSILTEVNHLLAFISHIPWLRRILPSATDPTGIGKIIGISREVVKDRIEQGVGSKNDMLGSFLKHGLDPELADLEITIALFAGSDTTATSIRAILLHVITNPLVYGRLQREIDVRILDGTISSPVSEDEVRKLPYLQACIREGLRIFPPITYLRERVTPAHGDNLNGFSIPAGVNIGFNLPGLLLNDVFGPDPRAFRPERWLEQEPARLRSMERVMDLVFGWGATRCLGMRMANANQSMYFVEVFRRWDVVTTKPLKPWTSRCHGIFYQKDFFVRLTPRKTGATAAYAGIGELAVDRITHTSE